MTAPAVSNVRAVAEISTVSGILDRLAVEFGTPRRVVLSLSKDENPKLVVLLFGAETHENGGSRAGRDGGTDQDTPRLVVKIGFSPAAADAVRAEGRSLRALAGLEPALDDGSTPRFVTLVEAADGTLLATTGCAGAPMAARYHRWRHTASFRRVRDDFTAADRWLRRLHRPAGVRVPPAHWDERLIDRWAGDGSLLTAVRAVRSLQDRLGDRAAVVMVHGDFWAGNLLMTGTEVSGVVDWEHAGVPGDPLRDRVRFALSYVLYLDRHTRDGHPVRGHRGLVAGVWGAGVRHALTDRCWCSDLIAEFLSPCLPVGPGRADWRDALLLGLAEVAVLSDDTTFAHHHLALLAELARNEDLAGVGAVRPTP